MNKSLLGYHALALLVVAIWGVTFVCTKVLISAGLQPAQIFAIRFVMAYAGIWALCLVRRRGEDGKQAVKLFSKSALDEAIFVFLGITGGSFYFLTENTALAYTQACNVSFLVCSAPLFTALFTLVFKRFSHGRIARGLEDIRLGWPLGIGTLLALGGMALVVFERQSLQLSPKGDLFAIGAAVCWGLYSIFMAQMTSEYGAVFATRKVFFYGLLTIIPFLLGGDSATVLAALSQPSVILNLLFLGLVASLFCFILWNKVMSRLGNFTTTNYVYLNPFFTLITSMIFLGERMTLLSVIGSLSIVFGVILSGRK
ncbi:MAG: DMT family transporter [Bacteroidales bacterium]|nr:DMT family transporter [Bacteroidales bacterium]